MKRQNPFNATKPAEWATMSKKLRKAWNRRHWRADAWKAALALKKEATRLRHRKEKGGRWSALAEGALESAVDLVRGNPRGRRARRGRHVLVRTNRYRAGRSSRTRSNPVLLNPRRRRSRRYRR